MMYKVVVAFLLVHVAMATLQDVEDIDEMLEEDLEELKRDVMAMKVHMRRQSWNPKARYPPGWPKPETKVEVHEKVSKADRKKLGAWVCMKCKNDNDCDVRKGEECHVGRCDDKEARWACGCVGNTCVVGYPFDVKK